MSNEKSHKFKDTKTFAFLAGTLMTAGLSSVIYFGATGLAGNNTSEINGREYTADYIKNVEYYDETGSHLFIYDTIYNDILNQYTTKANLKKELTNYLSTNGEAVTVQDLGQEEYNKEMESLRKFYLQNELYKDLLDVKQSDLDKAYKDNSEVKNYIAVTVDSEWLENNKGFETSLVKMMNGAKTTEDIKKIEEYVGKTQQGQSEMLQYNKYRFEKLPQDRQEIMNSLKVTEVKKEETKNTIGVTFFYKFLGVTKISQNNFEGQYLKDLADEKEIGELDNVMERLNEKDSKKFHFSKDLIDRVKSEIKIMTAQMEENAEQDTSTELEEVEDNKVKQSIKQSEKTSVEKEVNSFTK